MGDSEIPVLIFLGHMDPRHGMHGDEVHACGHHAWCPCPCAQPMLCGTAGVHTLFSDPECGELSQKTQVRSQCSTVPPPPTTPFPHGLYHAWAQPVAPNMHAAPCSLLPAQRVWRCTADTSSRHVRRCTREMSFACSASSTSYRSMNRLCRYAWPRVGLQSHWCSIKGVGVVCGCCALNRARVRTHGSKAARNCSLA